MDKKNVLFVGDLRPGMNFGAIATSQCLMDLVKNEVGEAHFESIDIRSFAGRTSIDGPPPFRIPNVPFGQEGNVAFAKKRRLRRQVKDLLLGLGLRRLLDSMIRIPSTWPEFEAAGRQFGRGSWLPYERRLLKWADFVVVNAEGSIVHNIHNPQGKYRLGARYMLFMAYLAKVVMGKPVAVVNHIIDPDNDEFKKVISNLYPKLDAVAVRDPVSVENLRALGIQSGEFVPDALFSYSVEDGLIEGYSGRSLVESSKPLVLVGDSASIPYVRWDRSAFYGQLFDRLRKEGFEVVFIDGASRVSDEFEKLCSAKAVPRITVYNTLWEQLGAVLAKSAVFFSGRWHASILATMAGCPSVLFGSDSHKTRALHEMVGCRTPFLDVKRLPELMDEIIVSIHTEIQLGTKRREELKEIAITLRQKTHRYTEIVRKLGSCSSHIE